MLDKAVNKGDLSTEKTEILCPKTWGAELNPGVERAKTRSTVTNRREPSTSETFGMLGIRRERKNAAVNRIGIKHFHHKMFGSPKNMVSNPVYVV